MSALVCIHHLIICFPVLLIIFKMVSERSGISNPVYLNVDFDLWCSDPLKRPRHAFHSALKEEVLGGISTTV